MADSKSTTTTKSSDSSTSTKSSGSSTKKKDDDTKPRQWPEEETKTTGDKQRETHEAQRLEAEEAEPTEEQQAAATDHLNNPKVQIEPGQGELLGPDLVKINEDGDLETVEGVPDPPYDLNAEDPVAARKPDHNEPHAWG